MIKAIALITILSLCNLAWADDRITGIYCRTHEVAGRDQDFYSKIEIRRISEHKAKVTLVIVEATAGSSCGGGISGVAEVKGNHLFLQQTNEEGDECTLAIEVMNKVASVVSDEGCMHWSGAACSMGESAIDLPKISGDSKH